MQDCNSAETQKRTDCRMNFVMLDASKLVLTRRLIFYRPTQVLSLVCLGTTSHYNDPQAIRSAFTSSDRLDRHAEKRTLPHPGRQCQCHRYHVQHVEEEASDLIVIGSTGLEMLNLSIEQCSLFLV